MEIRRWRNRLPYNTRPRQTCRVNARQLAQRHTFRNTAERRRKECARAPLWYMTGACCAAPAEIGLRAQHASRRRDKHGKTTSKAALTQEPWAQI